MTPEETARFKIDSLPREAEPDYVAIERAQRERTSPTPEETAAQWMESLQPFTGYWSERAREETRGLLLTLARQMAEKDAELDYLRALRST